MSQISAINKSEINFKQATYNAVKIQINKPQANISDCVNEEDNGIYNAISIEVNEPKINKGEKHCNHFYEYPNSENPVTADLAQIHKINLPKLPVPTTTYQTTNIINNRTLINAKLGLSKAVKPENNKKVKEQADTENIIKAEKSVIPTPEENSTKPAEEKVVIIEETIIVPEPNISKIEDQKINKAAEKAPSFKAEVPRTVEIIPSVDIKPSVDIPLTLKNLSSSNFDVQAQQMEDLAKIAMEDPQSVVPYIVTEVFTELIEIVNKDTSALTPPSEKQIEARKKIIINELVKEKARAEKQDLSKIELPFLITEDDIKEASALSPLEQAERNKEYGLYTIAILSKVYTDEVQKHTGNVVPLTELPGISDMVDVLRYNKNPGIKIAAMDALRYLNRTEYSDEIKSVLTIATKDADSIISENANKILQNI